MIIDDILLYLSSHPKSLEIKRNWDSIRHLYLIPNI